MKMSFIEWIKNPQAEKIAKQKEAEAILQAKKKKEQEDEEERLKKKRDNDDMSFLAAII